ncbi:unnamed protein product [Cuscuta campestris]|uniref:Pectinesterase inhibitor domain-containing protein n=1 Tax=Cuscuta campestris TaxID=132261 RepID=A0A484LSQ6_9ASTE|nr:unnamed protein product [Cuscuta campestris]
MAKFAFLFGFLSLLLPLLTAAVSAPNKNDTTLMLWGCSSTTNRALCLSYLRSDPRSFAAGSYTELGKIMAGFAMAKAKDTLSYVTKLSGPGGRMKGKAAVSGLETCRRGYGRIISVHIPNALRTLPVAGEEEASRRLGDAIGEEVGCQEAVGKSRVKSLLTKRNRDFHDVTILAQDLWFLVWS